MKLAGLAFRTVMPSEWLKMQLLCSIAIASSTEWLKMQLLCSIAIASSTEWLKMQLLCSIVIASSTGGNKNLGSWQSRSSG